MVIACAALHPLDRSSAELACVATHPDYQGRDRGERLIRHVETAARREGIERLFVLTTRTAHWFAEQGWQPADVADLPPARQSTWHRERGSRVLQKRLAVAS